MEDGGNYFDLFLFSFPFSCMSLLFLGEVTCCLDLEKASNFDFADGKNFFCC